MQKDFAAQARNHRNAYLLKTEAAFAANSSSWISGFAEHFQSVCALIKKTQDESALSPVSYLEYTMLYTNFANRRYVSEVRVYGDQSYLDKNQRIVGEYDISFLFEHFDRLWYELTALKQSYLGKISVRDVTAFMLQVLPDFYAYLASIARYAVAECAENKPFADIDKNDTFMVNVGDYMAATENVFIETKNKDTAEIIEWFHEKHEYEYMAGDYSGLDFSRLSFQNANFCRSQFRGSDLSHSSLEGSSFIKSNFRNANMEKACLDGCSIHEADFSNAILKNASFINANARAGCAGADEEEWKSAGFLPAIFRNADLAGADFTDAVLCGADFTGANLTGVNFSGAVLTDSIFTNAVGAESISALDSNY